MRLALLSDIHGNFIALQAVLSDLQQQGGADKTWVLGDLAAFGHDPAACLQALRDLPSDSTSIIRGNTDRELLSGERPAAPPPEEATWDSFRSNLRDYHLNLLWGMDQLSWVDVEFLLKLPPETALEVEGYGWLVGVHAAPGDDMRPLLPDSPDDEVLDALMEREGRLALGGHTHRPMDRQIGQWRMVNPGSVGIPLDGDPRASYALLHFEDGQLRVEQRRVAYDIEAVIADLHARGYPAPAELSHRLRTGSPRP